MTQNGINKIFDLFDDDHTGSINSNNIRRVAKELGETMNVQELEEMLQRAASNGREISREDFYNIMTKKAFWFGIHFWLSINSNIISDVISSPLLASTSQNSHQTRSILLCKSVFEVCCRWSFGWLDYSSKENAEFWAKLPVTWIRHAVCDVDIFWAYLLWFYLRI